MSGLVVLISLALLAVCQANVAVAPPIRCGETPKIFRCLSSPHVVQPEIAAQCDSKLPECEKLTCIYRKSGWMDGDKVNKAKLSEYFDNFAKENPGWQTGVEVAKTACLQGDLPPQGIHLNCPAYDVTHCSTTAFVKNAPLSQWNTSKDCDYPRQYAASCPFCPEECFGAQIPVGSCNACLTLPRSP